MAVSSIAKIIAKNLAKKKQLQSASKKITSKDVKEVYSEAKRNPGGARKVPTLSKPRTARTGPIAQKTSSGGVKVTTLGGRKGKKPDTKVTTKRILSEEKPTRSRKIGPIESGTLSPRGLNRPLGSAKKPAEKPNYPDLTPAQRERYAAMLKASSKKFSKERRKFEKTSIAKRKERAGKPLSGTPRPSRDKSLPSMESRKATTDKRITELTPREIAILRKVGKRDYSRGEVNTLAERTVQGEANRRVEQGLRNKKARNDVQNEITRIENRIAEAQRVRRNAERVRRLEADKRALQAFLNSRKKGK
jgi:uncharacterized protein (UPF0335 family)